MLRLLHSAKSAMKTAPQIFLPKPTTIKRGNNFNNSVKFIIVIAQYFGFFPVLGLPSNSWKNIDFKWWSSINIYSLIILFGAIIQSFISTWFLFSTKNLQRFSEYCLNIECEIVTFSYFR